MAKQHGTAGATPRGMAAQQRNTRSMLLLASLVLLLVLPPIFLLLNFRTGGVASVVLILLFLIVVKVIERKLLQHHRQLRKGIRNADRGATGEEDIARQLHSLPDDYLVLHGLCKVAGDIDHIVVGPTGIFVIETKAHGGQITANGEQLLLNGHATEKNFIAQCWRNAFWVRDVLKNIGDIEVPVTPLLVFSNAFVTIRRPVKGVRVVHKGFLLETILRAPARAYPIEQVSAILRQKAGRERVSR